jgi:hypothetical protein
MLERGQVCSSAARTRSLETGGRSCPRSRQPLRKRLRATWHVSTIPGRIASMQLLQHRDPIPPSTIAALAGLRAMKRPTDADAV